MKRLFAQATVALGAVAAALIALDGGHALAAARSIAPGDVLTYDLTLDVQLHALGAKSNPSMDSVRSGAGTHFHPDVPSDFLRSAQSLIRRKPASEPHHPFFRQPAARTFRE